tara:strand:+ start:1726 stop:1926 length:201 start_codon:yes stop_codon:yes gene_type:complete
LQKEPAGDQSTVQSDTSPEGPTIQSALNGQTQSKEQQADQQPHHRPEAEIETSVHKTEDQRLTCHS